MSKECECPEEHTITKLGHCMTCPYYSDLEPSTLDVTGNMSLFVCAMDNHRDGTPHDFEWATYSDELMSYGVCRCGLDSMTLSMLTGP